MQQLTNILITTPCAGALLVLACARFLPSTIRCVALLTTILSSGIACGLAGAIAASAGDSAYGPHASSTAFHADGLNVLFLVLTSLLTLSAVLISWRTIEKRAAPFFAMLLVFQAGALGVFAASNVVWFLTSWEACRIAMFFLIGQWGGGERRQAAAKFYLYTLVGGGLVVLGLMLLVTSHQQLTASGEITVSIPRLIQETPQFTGADTELAENWEHRKLWIFACLAVGLGIQIPMFPFHTWMQGAQVEAPAAGSLLLNGVWLKLGAFGVLQLLLPLFPDLCRQYADLFRLLAGIGVVYGVMLSLVQDDLKRLAASMTLSLMSLSVLGLLSMNAAGISGGILLMLGHAAAMGILICLTEVLFDRFGTREAEAFGGLMFAYPRLGALALLATISLTAFPPTAGFSATILTILGLAERDVGYVILTLCALLLGTWCWLRIIQRILWGKTREPHYDPRNRRVSAQPDSGRRRDLGVRELAALIPLAVVVTGIGLVPQFVLNQAQPSVRQLADRLEDEQLPRRISVSVVENRLGR